MESIHVREKDGNEVKVDVIAELHNRTAHHVLELIFQNFDAESLRQAEIVSHLWNNAIHSLNLEKLWSGILHNKVTFNSIWKYLNDINKDCNIVGYGDTRIPGECFSERKMLSNSAYYSKLEFAVKIANENRMIANGFTRENIILAENLSGLTHLLSSDIYFAFYNENLNEFQIFNRENLERKLVFKVLEDFPFVTNDSAHNYTIIEQCLVYPTTRCRFVCLDILSGSHSVHSSFTETEEEQLVSFMTSTNNVLAICVKLWKNDREVALDIYQWRYENFKSIDWKSYQKLHCSGSHNKKLTIDRHYLMIQSYKERACQIDLRKIDSLETKINLTDIRIGKTRFFLFAEGLVFFEENNTIKVIDIISGVMWNIWKEVQSNNQICNFVVTTEVFYALSYDTLENSSEFHDLNVSFLTLSSWKLSDVCNRQEMISREPNVRLTVCVPKFRKVFPNHVNITFAWVNYGNIHFHKLTFLPMCSYCKIINRLTKICSLCESVKYCSSLCQELDWNTSHIEKCKIFQKLIKIDLELRQLREYQTRNLYQIQNK